MKKIILITGATSGVGRAVAIGLASKEHQLVLIARNQDKGLALLRTIQTEYPTAHLDLLISDLAIQQDIRQVAAIFGKKYKVLDVLINCAGVVMSQRVVTPDGLESTFAVNYLSHFLLTNLLLEPLRKAKQGRILNVASLIPPFARINFTDLQSEKKYSSTGAYLQAKVADVMFTYSLAARLKETAITVNAVHPGIVKTNLGVETSTGVLQTFVRFAMRYLTISPEISAKRIIRLALSEEVRQTTGCYFKAAPTPVKTNAYSYNLAHQQRLWQDSERLTRFQTDTV